MPSNISPACLNSILTCSSVLLSEVLGLLEERGLSEAPDPEEGRFEGIGDSAWFLSNRLDPDAIHTQKKILLYT